VDGDKTQQQLVQKLLDELDRRAQKQQHADGGSVAQACRRKAPRDACRAPCRVRCLRGNSSSISELGGWTRNISRGGVGLVLRRMFTRDEPIEVEIRMAGRKSVFLAGLVASCRYAGRGLYEVGVSLRVAGATPVFSHDPATAMQKHAWLRVPDHRH
jgi:hypothetical protein